MEAKVDFISVADFKGAVASVDSVLEVLFNKATEKKFMSLAGQNYRVQGDIDNTLPIKVLVPLEDGVRDYDNACLVNVDPNKGADTVFSL
tara:strand:+ start:16242 stop:16511 length:270 start_codon:yes stop_codon:yes gene_type:complete